ncbi:MAG: 16S rRNA (guanine(966)-N(2))-methyltransferase RsmD [Mycoplasmataceae bacterium]|nr:16S rRNA (guanine(966)-N(2))-methyltransferase RsmD [Mycoplasmataceae bacterium]
MKINFGIHKRKTLIIGDNKKMRPTQSMAKSIIFNVLEIDENKSVLDLFSGTGALGFEAASLGAEKVYWIDNNLETIMAINENIKRLKLDQNNFKAFKTDFRRALKKINFKPDIIFLDPPFIATKYYDEALKIINDNNILADDGVIVLEKNNNLQINEFKSYKIILNKIMGNKNIIFLKRS